MEKQRSVNVQCLESTLWEPDVKPYVLMQVWKGLGGGGFQFGDSKRFCAYMSKQFMSMTCGRCNIQLMTRLLIDKW